MRSSHDWTAPQQRTAKTRKQKQQNAIVTMMMPRQQLQPQHPGRRRRLHARRSQEKHPKLKALRRVVMVRLS